MNAASKLTALVDDLAARWTDRILEKIGATGVSTITVDTELETWHMVKKALYAQLVRQSADRAAGKPSRRTDYTPGLRLSAMGN
jgi:hypothetical protein